MSVNRFHAIALLLFVTFSTTTFGGKLSSIRNKSGGAPKASRPARAPKPAEDRPAPEREEPEPAPAARPARNPAPRPAARSAAPSSRASSASRTAPRTAARSSGKLSEIRERSRRPPRVASAPAPNRDRPRRSPVNRGRRHNRPRHSPSFGLHFSSAFDTCPPPLTPPPVTIVEEYHYYPPVMPPEPALPTDPAIVRGQPMELPPLPAVEQRFESVESVSVEPVPFESTVFSDPLFLEDPFNVRFEIDYAADEDDVTRLGFGLLANATGGFGVDTGVRLFREGTGDERDHMWVGDFNIVYELFPTKSVRTRAGLGVNFLADHYGSEAGLNLTAGTDIFVGSLTLTGEFDLGTVGEADLSHGRASVALRHSDFVESFVGYDYLDIGGVKIHGLLAGMRFRF